MATSAPARLERLDGLVDVETLDAFARKLPRLQPSARKLVAQAIDLLSGYYVHLPLKRAMHGVDPVQALRTIQDRLERPDADLDLEPMVEQLLSIFTALRDLHTALVLPEPWRNRVAFLPFLVEECFEGDDHARRYVVTKVREPVPAGFRPGVEVLRWNWVDIERAVEANAERNKGSNADARHARGVDRLTYRWLGASPLPDEERVVIAYRDPEEQAPRVRTATFRWHVASTPELAAPTPAPAALCVGKDLDREHGRRLRRALFAGAAAPGGEEEPWFAWRESTLPDALRWAILPDPEGSAATFGYLRIHSFDVDDPDAFVAEVVRILGEADMQATEGLLVDVRGNGGGLVAAGERILQLLAPGRIDPEPMQCLATAQTLALAAAPDSMLEGLEDAIREAIQVGSPLTSATPTTPPAACNDIGQRYQAPVAVICDALSYSTTDIFVAGFRDHSIGPVIGTDGCTGAGGAQVWYRDQLEATLAGDGARAPQFADAASCTFAFALRRSLRVGAQQGRPLEDLGVEPDHRCLVTREDVLRGNRDLLREAIGTLRTFASVLPRARLAARVRGDAIALRTGGLDRVDVNLDGRPYASVDVPGTRSVPVEESRRGWRAARLDGYADGALAASFRLARRSGRHDGDQPTVPA